MAKIIRQSHSKAPTIRELNEKFAEDMNRDGHTKAFRTVQDEFDVEFLRPSSSGEEENIYGWLRALYRNFRGQNP
jgi:hypothetical protein